MKKHAPPRLAEYILRIWCGKAYIEDLEGDLEEWFHLTLKKKSPFITKFLYFKQVVSICFSYALRSRKKDASHSHYSTLNFSPAMIKNYIKVSLRNLRQYKYFTFLNAFGLAIGMSVSLLLIAIISYVSTYDNFHSNKENIYTIISTKNDGVLEEDYALAPAALADKLKNEFAGAREVVKIQSKFNEEVKLAKGTTAIRGYFVEPNFLDVFSYGIISGNAHKALTIPNSIIISETTALRIFNSIDVVGKSIELSTGEFFEINAVMKDHPINSHLKFEALVSYSSLPQDLGSVTEQWTNYPYQYIYLLLTTDAQEQQLQEYLSRVAKEQYSISPIKVSFDTQHLSEITMGPDLRYAIGPKWELSGMVVFMITALLILLPACFNFTNLSIARALKRAKEVGLRKAMGSANSQIFFQIITETIVITFLSLIGAFLLFLLIREEFKTMMVASNALDLSITWRMVVMFIVFAAFTGIMAGIFPALYFSKMNPIEALKNKSNMNGFSGIRIRKALSIFQFALSFCFILSLVVFGRQYHYSLNFDFGFDKENIVDVQLQDIDNELVKNEFRHLASVRNISMSSDLLGIGHSYAWVKDEKHDSTEVAQIFIDQNFIPNLNLKFLAGKNFPDESWHHERFIIVNEQFLKFYKIDEPAEALGMIYSIDGKDLEVIGVLKNFHYASLRNPIEEFFFRMNPKHYAYANLKVNSADAYTMFSSFEDVWKNIGDGTKLQAEFYEDEVTKSYATYTTLLKITGFCGIIAITVSLLGMIGMVIFTSEAKTKEVSVRKVLGAGFYSINYLLSKDYLKLMMWAIIFSIPPALFIFDELLSGIQYYSIKLTVWDFLISIMLLLLLGIPAIISQTWKTANANPAVTLKSE